MRATQVTLPLPSKKELRANLAPMYRTQLGGPQSRAMTSLVVIPADRNLLQVFLRIHNSWTPVTMKGRVMPLSR